MTFFAAVRFMFGLNMSSGFTVLLPVQNVEIRIPVIEGVLECSWDRLEMLSACC